MQVQKKQHMQQDRNNTILYIRNIPLDWPPQC